MHIYTSIYNSSSGKILLVLHFFPSLSLVSTGINYRGYIMLYFDSFSHFIPIFSLRLRSRLLPFSKLIDRHSSYILDLTDNIFWHLSWTCPIHSFIHSIFLLLLIYSGLLFDTNIYHCFKKKTLKSNRLNTCQIISFRFRRNKGKQKEKIFTIHLLALLQPWRPPTYVQCVFSIVTIYLI